MINVSRGSSGGLLAATRRSTKLAYLQVFYLISPISDLRELASTISPPQDRRARCLGLGLHDDRVYRTNRYYLCIAEILLDRRTLGRCRNRYRGSTSISNEPRTPASSRRSCSKAAPASASSTPVTGNRSTAPVEGNQEDARTADYLPRRERRHPGTDPLGSLLRKESGRRR